MLGAATVRRRLRRFPRTFAPYRRLLVQRYGEERTPRLEGATRKEYAALLPETPRFPGRFNLFNAVVGYGALIVSLFRALRADGIGAEESAGVLYDVAERSFRPLPRPARWVARKLVFSPLFLRLAQTSARRVHDHPGGWAIDYRKGDGRTSDWCFECSRCGMVEYLRAHGAAELAPFCNYVDYLQSRAFGLGMQNPANIGQGDAVCREHFREGRETPVPDNLRALAYRESSRRVSTTS